MHVDHDCLSTLGTETSVACKVVVPAPAVSISLADVVTS
jgi:hypothetical protein